MTEVDVTLTDYGLAILCSCFVWMLWKKDSRPSLNLILWVIFFGSVAAASITGGTVHGFFLDESTLEYRLLWPMTLFAIGITAATAWILTGVFVSGSYKLKPWIFFAGITFLIYAVVVLFYSQRFVVVILNYLPAMVALLIASVRGYLQTRSPHFLWISAGIIISFFAAFIQQTGIGLHPNYFNHNSTYHMIQALGLWGLFKGARGALTLER